MLLLAACAFHTPPPTAGAPEPLALATVAGENRPFVVLDGRTWLVDTGYHRTTCDDAYVAALGVPVRENVGRQRGETGTVHVGRARLGPMTVGGWRMPRVDCAVRDLQTTSSVGPGVAGVLGSDVLRHYRLDFDFGAGTLRLERPAAPPPAGAARLRTEGLGPRRRATLAVAGREVDVLVDTGADHVYLPLHTGTILQSYEGQRQGTGPGGTVHLQVVVRDAGAMAVGALPMGTTRYFERDGLPCLGEPPTWLRWAVPRAWTSGPCPLVADRARDGLLGMDALGGARLVIDYPGRWLWREEEDEPDAPPTSALP